MAAEHPDEALVRATIADLTAWLEQPPLHDPTSQITGGGAVSLAEQRFSQLHDYRPCVLVPSASYGMRAALLAVDIGPGKRVLIPGADWGSTLAAVCSVGATPVPVPVDASTMTMDPARITGPADAVVLCHLHGVPADVPAVREVVGDEVPIIEDCAQAQGSQLDGRPVGTMGDLAVFSFGPGSTKSLPVGEAGMIVCADDGLGAAILRLTAHPVRQILSGVEFPRIDAFSMRVDPTAAIRLAIALARWQPVEAIARHARLRATVEDAAEVVVLGSESRRLNAARAVPLAMAPGRSEALQVRGHASAAVDIGELIAERLKQVEVLLAERVVVITQGGTDGGRHVG